MPLGILALLRKDDDLYREYDRMGTFLRTLSAQYDHGHEIGDHDHGWGQLVYASRGAIHVTAASQAWLIPSARAVWLPPDTPHRLRMRGATRLRTVYVPPESCTALPHSPLGLLVTPLLRELVLELTRAGHVDGANRFHRTIGEAFLSALAQAERLPLALTMPADRRALRVAQSILADPASSQTLDALAAGSGGSLRTIQRIFLDETGMPLADWREVARVKAAAAVLPGGKTVTEAPLAGGVWCRAGVSRHILPICPSRCSRA